MVGRIDKEKIIPGQVGRFPDLYGLNMYEQVFISIAGKRMKRDVVFLVDRMHTGVSISIYPFQFSMWD